jgi:biopolymer transport protein ExbD
MARRSMLAEEEETNIDLSSMIDCIFILLIFFIVTTVFVEEKGLQVNKPEAAASTSNEESDSVVLQITAENQILMDGKPIPLADVARQVAEGMSDAETPVTIRAHEKSSHGTFLSVWDAAKQGGAVMLSFSTVN